MVKTQLFFFFSKGMKYTFSSNCSEQAGSIISLRSLTSSITYLTCDCSKYFFTDVGIVESPYVSNSYIFFRFDSCSFVSNPFPLVTSVLIFGHDLQTFLDVVFIFIFQYLSHTHLEVAHYSGDVAHSKLTLPSMQALFLHIFR